MQEIFVAIWNQAPFQGSIFRGIEELNKHLESKNIPVSYEPILVAVKKPKEADIFILDGGEDVNPERYGHKNESSYFSNARDKAEFSLTKYYYQSGTRLSGICRGHQLLNVFFGGTLWQDIHNAGLVNNESHSSGHKVVALKQPRNMILPSFTGESLFTVSSLHHQAVKDYGSNLNANLVWKSVNKRRGYYSNSIVEGIESRDGKVRGLQCHPEFRGYPKDGLLFAFLMHVDSFTKDFISLDKEKLAKKYGKQHITNKFYPEDVPAIPRFPSSSSRRYIDSLITPDE